MERTRARDIVEAVVSIVVCQAAGLIGSIATFPSIPTWYASLDKPPFNPPNWVFGPVWTTLYTLMGIAAFLVWRKGIRNREVKIALGIFVVQLVLNTLWSVVFFGLNSLADDHNFLQDVEGGRRAAGTLHPVGQLRDNPQLLPLAAQRVRPDKAM
jgi:benzodiazapine receptor